MVSPSRLADNGATEHQIMSVAGRQTSKEAPRHTKAARQKALAESAAKLMGKGG